MNNFVQRVQKNDSFGNRFGRSVDTLRKYTK